MEHLLRFLALAALWVVPALANAANPDVNGDGDVDVTDLNIVVNAMLGRSDSTTADVNDDGIVDVADINEIVNNIVNPSLWFDSELCPDGHHPHWIDLGLPSGTLWACCNVGASIPTDYGDYFAWGETESKESYSFDTYKWCIGSRSSQLDPWNLTKYCTKSSEGYNGFVDNKTELDPEDDAAYVNWAQRGRMPSLEQRKELRDNCTSKWAWRNGVKGCLFSSKINGASLFLPATGGIYGKDIIDAGVPDFHCSYWLRTLNVNTPQWAYFLTFGYESVSMIYDYGRVGGHSVRAVRVGQN